MNESAVVHDTFVVERSYPKSPERVFAAFANAAQKRRWYAESDSHEVEEFTMDFRVGGGERLQYHFKQGSPFAGIAVSNDGRFEDIVPNQRIVTSSAMTVGGNRISVSQVTIELLPSGSGTKVICTHQGVFFEGSDGPQIRQGGWRALLDRLARELVDAPASAAAAR